MRPEALLKFELTKSFIPSNRGIYIGREHFEPYLNGRSFRTGMQYEEKTISQTPSVSWRPDVPREHDRTRGGNRKH